ncbi:FHA domain-containing protein [Dethiobacter alkaliphilus]|uniref:FHA domain-containing protein n=1 Tax=Dethiobacter alkaliphilus TaxID=427926 RepID=UPI0022279A73|nr:FHA domain-containing protein [Dethiobacter alkaliphilus]MCW3488702.1 FHA domain-containing protein [Dethiobacter alkaliphilus]
MSEEAKYCPHCDAPNKGHALYCSECMAGLMTFDSPLEELAENKEPAVDARENKAEVPVILPDMSEPLASLKCISQPEFVFPVRDNSLLGRQGDINVSPLERSIYISREHARFRFREGKWLLDHLSRNSHTYVNGIEVPGGSPQVICDGDKITLGNTSFLFREEK